jgi:CHAD domain-containing protein
VNEAGPASPAPAAAEAGKTRFGLELRLHPDDEPAFWRAPLVAALRAARPLRRRRLAITALDGPRGELAGAGRRLVRVELGATRNWRLERIPPAWPPRGTGEPLAQAPELRSLGMALPETLTEIGRFAGVTRRLARPAPCDGVAVIETQLGMLRAFEAEQAACRVLLEGSPREAFALARALAGPLRLRVADAALLVPAPERPPAAPALSADLGIDDALAELIAALSRALLYWAPSVGRFDTEGPEPVHQMRVALRRLRSALKLFGRAVPRCPELDAVGPPLRELGQVLGGARDWDVFIDGLGAAVGAAFPRERAVGRLLREARARRGAAYHALEEVLDGAVFRQLGLQLAELAVARPWACAGAAGPPDALPSLHAYARHALRKRLRKALLAGEAIEAQPVEALHALRLQCKRLRYAAEFLAPLFPGPPTRRFVRRLASVQERLGRLNDGVVAASLIQQLGGGAGRALAAGVVRGYVAARTERARGKAERAWRRLRQCDPPWD